MCCAAPESSANCMRLRAWPAGTWLISFNAHRIHYDRAYASEVEGYPGLVVHGPLTAVLLSELVRHSTARPMRAFSFRGVAPLFDLGGRHAGG